jgi:SpoVK/Ycf46/Vps4 family AAA+-type ATPase
MYFVATNHIEYFDRAVTRSERYDAIIFMSPPSFAAKTKELLRILKDMYGVEPTLASDITKENVDKAMPTDRCQALKEVPEKTDKDKIGAETLPQDRSLAKFALLRWDELHDLALQIETRLGQAKVISKQALESGLAQIKDRKSRPLVEYRRFTADVEDYERFDASRNARWIVSEIEGFAGTAANLPQPVTEADGVRVIDAPVGPVESLKVKGYVVEKKQLPPGKIRLRQVQDS